MILKHYAYVDGSAAAARVAARVFVGRMAERTLLRHLLRDATEGRPAMVVVTGVPGAGKTALLEWTAGAAASLGAEVLHASCYESSLPLAALGRLVAPFPGLAETVRGPAASATGPIDATTTGGLAHLLIDTLAARARRRPLALLLDDAQDLGDASRTVLDDALAGLDDAAARHSMHLFVMVTARYPIASGGLAGRVGRLGTARLVPLGGFDDREVFEFLAAAGKRPRPAVVRELLEDTGGLPLLIESEVQRWRSTTGRRGIRARHDTDDTRVRSIADALSLRFDQVDEPTRDALRQAAVLGEPWSIEELAAVIERPQYEVNALTDTAERARLVARSGQLVRFAHPLVRSAVLEHLPADRRRALHRAVAQRLWELHEPRGTLDDDVLVRMADHLLRGGPEVPRHEIAETALRAGRIAMGWAAPEAASRFLAASAYAAVGVHPADELARRYVEAGRAAYYDYDTELAETLLARAISYAREAGDDTVRLVAAMLLARMRGAQRRRPWDSIDVSELQAALQDGLTVDVAARVEAEAAVAEALIGSGDVETASPVLHSARRVAATAAPGRSIDDAVGRVDFSEGVYAMTLLDLDAADTFFAGALTHSTSTGNVLNEIMARSRPALVGLLRGAIRDSYTTLIEVEQRAIAEGFWGEAGLAAALIAFADALAGRAEAVDRVEQAYRQWRRTGNPWNAAILSAVIPALSARTAAPGGHTHDPSSLWSQRTDLPTPSVMAALAAIEAYDVPAVHKGLETAHWRHGFRGPLTLYNTAVPTALVEVGDFVGDSSMVMAGLPVLEQMRQRGVAVTLPWPATVSRLLAMGARHLGDIPRARRHIETACELTEREGLAPERPKCLLERARIAGADGAGARSEAESSMAEAVRAFDELLMQGWVARCDEIGRHMGLPPAIGTYGVTRDRTIFTDDVVGSAASNVRLGDVLYVEQLRVHDRLLRARFKEFRGLETKHTGDGVNAIFDDPLDAARCALAAVADFRAWNADEPELALQIRCGLAHGPLVASGGDFYGLAQAEAARLCDLADGGEILASARVVETCGPEVEAQSIGQRVLRGMPSATEIFRLTGP